MIDSILNLIKKIKEWQTTHDAEYSNVPVDNHSYLILNANNLIFKFVFSNELLRNQCKNAFNSELLSIFSYMVDQEEGFTYYLINE